MSLWFEPLLPPFPHYSPCPSHVPRHSPCASHVPFQLQVKGLHEYAGGVDTWRSLPSGGVKGQTTVGCRRHQQLPAAW